MKKIIRAFIILASVATIMVFGTSVVMADKEGDFYYSAFDGKATITGYCGSGTDVDIPSTIGRYTVTSIGTSAFNGCSSLTSVTIPGSVEDIGGSAFYDCNNMTNVTIENGVKSIGSSAFHGCTSLTSITIPESVDSIANSAFYGCSSLINVTIPKGVKSIEAYVFKDCSKLESITIPGSVKSIGTDAFNGCSSLTNITIPRSVENIKGYAFSGCTNLESVTIPGSVENVKGFSFYGCTNLKNVTIENGVKGIEVSSFGGCTNLESVTIPGSVESIGRNAFDGCKVKSLYIDDIGKYLNIDFDTSMGSYCYPLSNSISGHRLYVNGVEATELTIPGSVENVKGFAFYGCTSLTSVTIPGSVENIEGYAFYGCTGLTSVTIENGVKSIGSSAFYGCTNLTYITIPGSVDYIASDAFRECTNLTNVTIENGVKSIGGRAFQMCTSLESITIPGSVESIGRDAFDGCKVKSLYIDDIGKYLNIDFDTSHGYNCYPLYNSVSEHKLYVDGTEVTEIEIPGSVESIDRVALKNIRLKKVTIKYGVKSIESSAFSECTTLESVTIPGSVESIGEEAFYGCTSLADATIENGVKNIESSAFSECTNLESVTIPGSVESIGEEAFYGCTSLADATIENGVMNMGVRAFQKCTGLTGVTIPGSVESINSYAFSGCTNLTNVTIKDGIKSIGKEAFDRCSGLRSITIPGSVESINSYAFSECINLTNVTIKDGVKSIEEEAFSGCSSLTSITIPESVTSIGKYACRNCKELKTVIIFGNPVMPTYAPSSYWAPFSDMAVDTLYFDSSKTSSEISRHIAARNIVDINSSSYPSNTKYLSFETDSILLHVNDITPLSQYLNTSGYDSYDVEISDEKVAFYTDGKIVGISEGTCDVTVAEGDVKTTAKIIVTEADIELQSIAFAKSNLEMNVGDYAANIININPNNATGRSISYSSSNDNIANCDHGVIKALNPGEAVITAKSDNGMETTCKVVVNKHFENVIAYTNRYKIVKGDNIKLEYLILPMGATDVPKISFSSSNEDVLTIDENGIMTGVDHGTATVTVTVGDKSDSAEVNVITPVRKFEIDTTTTQVKCGQTYQIKATQTPEDTSDEIIWSSSTPSVATVDNNGLVTAKGKGVATITAKCGNFSSSCTIICPESVLTGIKFAEENKMVPYNQIFSPVLEYIPSTTTDDKTVAWSVEDNSVLSVTNDNKLKAVGIGATTLTATVGKHTTTCSITVVPAESEFDIPSDLTATCNQKLSEIALPTGFAWNNKDQSVGEQGIKTFKATFTPEDTTNYKAVSDIDIEVSVKHDFMDKWFSDEDNHWIECQCGLIAEKRQHSYEIKDVAPTCTEKGYSAKVCSTCGNTITESDISAKGHSFGPWETIKESSCLGEGSEQRVCGECGFIETRNINPEGHEWEAEYMVDKEATCTVEGSESIHCRNCDAVKDSRVINVLGHDLIHHDGKAATCIEKGWVTYDTCNRCEYTTYNEIPALGHNYKHYKNSAGLLKNGSEYDWCTNCNQIINKKTLYGYSTSYVKSFKVSKGKKCFTAKWKKQSKKNQKKFNGYQLRYSTRSDMAGAKYKNIGKSKKSLKIKKLGKKTKYYVQLRTYTGGFYSSWSTKTVVTK